MKLFSCIIARRENLQISIKICRGNIYDSPKCLVISPTVSPIFTLAPSQVILSLSCEWPGSLHCDLAFPYWIPVFLKPFRINPNLKQSIRPCQMQGNGVVNIQSPEVAFSYMHAPTSPWESQYLTPNPTQLFTDYSAMVKLQAELNKDTNGKYFMKLCSDQWN